MADPRHIEAALHLAEELGDAGEIRRALSALTMVAAERGDLAASQQFVDTELDRAAVTHHRRGVELHDRLGARQFV